jgi:hypothetical protein
LNMLRPCPMCDAMTECSSMPHFSMAVFECANCGRYLLGDYLAASLPQLQSWDAERKRVSAALRWASDRGTAAELKVHHDVMWLLGRFDMSEEDRADQEHRITEALVAAGEVPNVWTVPIHAVDRALKITSDESLKLVHEMLCRRAVRVRTRSRNISDPTDHQGSLSWWEKAPIT